MRLEVTTPLLPRISGKAMGDNVETVKETLRQMQELLDKQELLELVTRYCRSVDRCDLELLLSCFYEDAIDDHGTFSGRPHDVFPAILDRFRSLPPTQHIISNALFEVEGDVAYGEVYTGVRTSDASGAFVHGGMGRQIDRYERREGEWRIAHREVIVDWFDPGPGREHLTFDKSKKSFDDTSYRRPSTGK
jgi:hypothetical protein